MDKSDDRKPPAKVISMGKQSDSLPEASNPPKVKRKRRSPEKPWKKPKDMPKRPLSAYNLFFRDERERLLLSAGSEGKQGTSVAKASVDKGESSKATAGAKKQKKPSGIGFANLAKTIAGKWKELDNEVRAPYEKVAATEKKKYDEAVAEWRIKQAAKKKSEAEKKQSPDERGAATMRETVVPNLFSSERSLGSFSDSSNPYPSEWFHTATVNETSERDDSIMARGSVPPVVDTSIRASYERRGYESSMVNPAWSNPRQESAYYQQAQAYPASDSYPRYTPEMPRNTYLNQSMFSPSHDSSSRAGPAPGAHSGYRDYYQHPGQSMYHPSGRHGDMRMPRASSIPHRHEDLVHQQQLQQREQQQSHHPSGPPSHHLHQEIQQIHSNVAQLRSPRESSSRYPHLPSAAARGSGSHPRSASMPPHSLNQPSTSRGRSSSRRRHAQQGGEEMEEGSQTEHGRRPATDPTTSGRRSFNADQLEPTNNDEEDIVETSLHSLTESLDEDAISFITSMKYS